MCGLENGPITGRPSGYARSSPQYLAGRLVAQYHRIEASGIADSTFGEVM